MFRLRNASYVLVDPHPTLDTEKLTEKNWKTAQVWVFFFPSLFSDLLISDSIYIGPFHLDKAFSIREAIKYHPVITTAFPKNTRLN